MLVWHLSHQKDYKNVSLPITVSQPHSKAAELTLNPHKLRSSRTDERSQSSITFHGQNPKHLPPNHILLRKKDLKAEKLNKDGSKGNLRQAGSAKTCNRVFPGITCRQGKKKKEGKIKKKTLFSSLNMATMDQNNEHS